MTDLNELLERVKAATGPDRELDADLLEMASIGYYDYTRSNYEYQADDANRLDLTKEWWHPFPTRTIDAALALTERVLPGAQVGLDPIFFVDDKSVKWHAVICIPNWGAWVPVSNSWIDRHEERHTQRPMAILAATLSALIAKETP